jgi:hypothetical protein
MRATVSPAFPAVNGLITLIGLAGHVWALAATVAIKRATEAKDTDNVRTDIMFCSRKSVTPRPRGAAAPGKARRGRCPVFTKIGPSGHGTGCRRRGRRPQHQKRTFRDDCLMSALPRKRTLLSTTWMSALCHKRRGRPYTVHSARAVWHSQILRFRAFGALSEQDLDVGLSATGKHLRFTDT